MTLNHILTHALLSHWFINQKIKMMVLIPRYIIAHQGLSFGKFRQNKIFPNIQILQISLRICNSFQSWDELTLWFNSQSNLFALFHGFHGCRQCRTEKPCTKEYRLRILPKD